MRRRALDGHRPAEGSGHGRPEAVGEAAALVPDLLPGAEVLVGVGVGGLVDGGLEIGQGDDLLGPGPALDA